MDVLHHLFNFIMHLDEHLMTFVSQYGTWTYILLFSIIFCETGLIIAAFAKNKQQKPSPQSDKDQAIAMVFTKDMPTTSIHEQIIYQIKEKLS